MTTADTELHGDAAEFAARTAELARLVVRLREQVGDHGRALDAGVAAEAALQHVLRDGGDGEAALGTLVAAVNRFERAEGELRYLIRQFPLVSVKSAAGGEYLPESGSGVRARSPA